jgi:methyl-accepting chemotaxis protein
MTADQIHLVRKSFLRIDAMGHVAALVFYRRLFELAPELRPLFKSDIEAQSKKLTDMLGAAVALLTNPGELSSTLEALGARHVQYGAKPEHYETVGLALLDMLSTVLGSEFTPETRQAWTILLSEISNAMLAGAAKATKAA